MQGEQEKLTPMTTMKSKLCLSILLVILTAPLEVALAQNTLVIANGGIGGMGAQAFDPTTGLPISPGPTWKDTNWQDPDIILTNVSYDNLPLAEIGRDLRDRFKAQFDVLLPAPTSGENSLNRLTGLPVPATDWTQTEVQMRLKDVTASEVFSAMNLIFENDKTPLQWELKVNGHRQVALLRVLVDRNPQFPSQKREEVRKIYYVGDLIGDADSGGLTMEQITKTVTDVWRMADAEGGKLQFHNEAQLLVFTGTRDQIDFMEQTLAALRQKHDAKRIELAHPEQFHPRPPGPEPKNDESKSSAPKR